MIFLEGFLRDPNPVFTQAKRSSTKIRKILYGQANGINMDLNSAALVYELSAYQELSAAAFVPADQSNGIYRAQVIVLKRRIYSKRQINKKLNVSKTPRSGGEIDELFTDNHERTVQHLEIYIIKGTTVSTPNCSCQKIMASFLAVGRNINLMMVSKCLI